LPDAPDAHVLISSVKDEGPFLLEWVAHHLALGFDRVLLASNDCSDGSDRLLDALERGGWVGHAPHVPPPGEAPQHAGYAALRRRFPLDAAGWLMMLDADEFLNVHLGGHRVGDLTALAEPDVDAIALHAMTFAGGEGEWRPGRGAPRFTGRLAPGHKANTALKSLTRDPSRFRAIHNHSLVGFREGRPLRVMGGDGLVRELPADEPLWRTLRSAPVGPGAHRLAQVNHYATKTRDSFALRRRRGRGAAAAGGPERHTDAYWAERAAPAGEERSIARYDGAVEALMARMLADPEVARAQAECEALYGARARAQASGWRQEAE
jgi:hypothetical protein